MEARNDVAKERLFDRACSTCSAGSTGSFSTTGIGVRVWCSTLPPLVFYVAVVGDAITAGTEEPPCSADPICLLLFRGMSRKMSASSVSSSERGKMAWRRLLAADRLPAALADASSTTSNAAQWTSSVLALVWAAGPATCGQSTPGGGDTNTAARSRPLLWQT